MSPKFIPAEHLDHFLLASGVLMIMPLLNNFILRSSGIGFLLFLASLPGMALVAFAHNEIDPPEIKPEEMAPVALIPLCLLIIATSGFGGGGKKKTN